MWYCVMRSVIHQRSSNVHVKNHEGTRLQLQLKVGSGALSFVPDEFCKIRQHLSGLFANGSDPHRWEDEPVLCREGEE